MKSLCLLFLLALVPVGKAQETRQFVATLAHTNDPGTALGTGAFLLTGNYLTYRIDFFTATFVNSGRVASQAGGTVFQLDGPFCSADGGCAFLGEISLMIGQVSDLNAGLWSVVVDDAFRGAVRFDRACRFSKTNAVVFTAILTGDNPTNRFPRSVQWGRGVFGLTGNTVSYEITLPAVYAPYAALILRYGQGGHGSYDAAYLGTIDCTPTGASSPAADAADLELLPQCVIRGAFCVPEDRIPHLLAGQWVIILGRAPSFHSIAGVIGAVDSDRDGVPDYLDQCAGTAAGSLVNSNGCSIEQLVPCEGPWRNHAEYVNALKAVIGEFLKDGLITEAQQQNRLKEAAQSGCGKRR